MSTKTITLKKQKLLVELKDRLTDKKPWHKVKYLDTICK